MALGCHARALLGLLNGGVEILGFDKHPDKKNTYVVNEDEAPKVRKIFELFLETGSLNRTADALVGMGIAPKKHPNRKNKVIDRGLWTHKAVSRILRNKAYIGMREINRENINKDQLGLKSHERYQIVSASWPAIIEQEVFDRVQQLLDHNYENERRRLSGSERRVFLASKVLKCAECGRPMVGQSCHGSRAVHRYYMHSYSRGDEKTCAIKRVRADEVEQAIVHHLMHVLTNGRYLDQVAERVVSGASLQKKKASEISKQWNQELKTEIRN